MILKITFLIPREDDRAINRFAREVASYHKVKVENVGSMLAYLNNDKLCRSKQLLLYFGEELSKDCGVCDVCLKKRGEKNGLPNLPERILKQLSLSASSSRKLISILPDEEYRVLQTLRELLEAGKIAINNKNEYIIKL